MAEQAPATKTVGPVTTTANRLGFYAALLTTVLTVITFGIAILTPPLSGPYCTDSCYEYPYLDIASRFPRDYLWMYPAMVLTLVFVVLAVCIHHHATEGSKVFSRIGLSFALISAAILIVDYFVQVSVIQPSLENGETEGIALLTQYNPHGVFIALEDLGYLLMSVAFVFFAPVFSGRDRVEKALRWVFAGGFLLTILALLVITAVYGIEREYHFEVAAISIDWLVLIVTGVLLSRVFKRAADQPS